jgi:excisionase family DNA binding protein
METDVLVSLKDAAQQLGVSVDFLKKRIRAGVIQPVRMGRLVKISQLDLDAWKRTGFPKLHEEVSQ